jgi:Zn-dependent protease
VPALLALSGVGFFGWAKPVPVDLRRLRSPRNQGVLVSLAGPATNLVLAALGAVLFIVLGAANSADWWALTLFYLGFTNLVLAVVNMIPIPPLDGSVLLERLLPAAWWPTYLRYRSYGMPVLLVIVLINYELHPGPITWLYDHLATWWLNLLLSH